MIFSCFELNSLIISIGSKDIFGKMFIHQLGFKNN